MVRNEVPQKSFSQLFKEVFDRVRGIPALSFYLVLITTLLLLCLGLFVVFSVASVHALSLDESPYKSFLRALVITVMGLVAFVAAMIIPLKTWRVLAPFVLAFTVFLQALILTPIGIDHGGNRNWIYLSFIGQSLQPSEFVKAGLCLYMAWILVKVPACTSRIGPALVWIGIPFLVVLALVVGVGRDMGTMIIIAVLVFGVLFLANISWRWVWGIIIAGIGMAVFMVMISSSRRARVMLFFKGSKSADPLGRELQPTHARWAFGSGGIFGMGPGGSREKWGYLPAAQTDYIYAIFGEEYGLVGSTVVLILFALLAYGMYRIICRHNDAFAKHLTAGIMCWIMFQALVNLLVVIGLAPVLGVPLPLMSSGGSSLISSLFALGLVLVCARTEPQLKDFSLRFWRRSCGGAVMAPSFADTTAASARYRGRSLKK